jgi:hypothetical protein
MTGLLNAGIGKLVGEVVAMKTRVRPGVIHGRLIGQLVMRDRVEQVVACRAKGSYQKTSS